MYIIQIYTYEKISCKCYDTIEIIYHQYHHPQATDRSWSFPTPLGISYEQDSGFVLGTHKFRHTFRHSFSNFSKKLSFLYVLLILTEYFHLHSFRANSIAQCRLDVNTYKYIFFVINIMYYKHQKWISWNWWKGRKSSNTR